MSKIKENIIEPSWKIISEDFSLRKFYFLPWMVSVFFFTALLVYQFTYTYVVFFWNQEAVLAVLLDYFHSEYLVPTLITWAIVFLFYIILNPIFENTVIQKINCKRNNKEITISEAFWRWLYSFMAVFEYSNTFNTLKVISIFNAYFFTVRVLWIERIVFLNYFFLFLLVIATIINILSSFSKYIIITENKPIFEAFSKSTKMVFLNIWTVLKLNFLMIILNIRVLLNFLIFLGIPVLIIASISFFASTILIYAAVISLWIIGLILFLLMSYISTTLEIFKISVWYFAYIEARKKIISFEEDEKIKD